MNVRELEQELTMPRIRYASRKWLLRASVRGGGSIHYQMNNLCAGMLEIYLKFGNSFPQGKRKRSLRASVDNASVVNRHKGSGCPFFHYFRQYWRFHGRRTIHKLSLFSSILPNVETSREDLFHDYLIGRNGQIWP